jgi:hypothetical protein
MTRASTKKGSRAVTAAGSSTNGMEVPMATATVDPASAGKLEEVDIKKLDVDDRYQRELQEGRVKRMVKEFNPLQVGAIQTSRRNGRLTVIDGQHRLAAAKELGLKKMPCVVHDDLTPEEEAALFVRLQLDRRSLKPVERFEAQVFAGDERADQIRRATQAAGYTIGQANHSPNRITAVVALERIYKRFGEQHLRQTLKFLREVWDGDLGAVNGYFIQGVAQLLANYGDRIGVPEKLRLQEASPRTIIRHAQGNGFAGGGYMPGVVSELRKVAGLRGRPRKFKRAES